MNTSLIKFFSLFCFLLGSLSIARPIDRSLLASESTHPVLSQLRYFELHDFTENAKSRLLLDGDDEEERFGVRGKSKNSKISYSFSALGSDHVIELEPHHFGKRAIPHYIWKGEGENLREAKVEHHRVDCLYKVSPGGNNEKKYKNGVFSFCEEHVAGKVVTEEGKQIHLQVIEVEVNREEGEYLSNREENAPGRRRLTVVYDSEDVVDTPATCGVANTPVSELESIVAKSLKKSSSAPPTNAFVELFAVNDKISFDKFGAGSFSHTLFLLSLVDDLYSVFSTTVNINMQVSGVLTITDTDPWELEKVFNSNGEILVDSNGLLSSFGDFMNVNHGNLAAFSPSVVPTEPQIDAAHLFTRHDFFAIGSSPTPSPNPAVVGLATISGVCNVFSQRVGTTQDLNFDSKTAVVMAHEIGHNLGFQHTNVAAPGVGTCTSPTPFIMDPSGSTASTWSDCSRSWWDTLGGGEGCVVSAAADPVTDTYCGNGIVDPGEQCDCGRESCTTVDPCCNGATCQYTVGCACAANDLCCDTTVFPCQVAAPGTTCRAKKDTSSCDFVETCDGSNITCPGDEYDTNGIACTISPFSGNCFRGACVSQEAQCQSSGFGSFCTLNTPVGSDPCSGLGANGLFCDGGDGICSSGFVLVPDDGTLCASGKGCFKNQCTDYASIPTEDACFNAQQDGGETDVDCGGANCFPCLAGKSCLVDSDCFGLCNSTTLTCEGDSKGEKDPGLGDIINTILQWIKDHILISSLIGGAIGLLILSSVMSSVYRSLCAPPKPTGYRNQANRNSAANSRPRGNSAASRTSRMSRATQKTMQNKVAYAVPVDMQKEVAGARNSQRVSKTAMVNLEDHL